MLQPRKMYRWKALTKQMLHLLNLRYERFSDYHAYPHFQPFSSEPMASGVVQFI